MPIAIVMDPHGNLSQGFIDKANIVRCYRESPHTDMKECHRTVARMFIDLLQHRRNIHPAYRKLPILLGGERCVSTDEPMTSINLMLNKIEQEPRILSASYHIGYLRHDSDKCGASVVVVPNMPEDAAYAEETADRIVAYVMSRLHDFHYTGTTDDSELAIDQVLTARGSPCFITDSGDNTTSGATGGNTLMLRQFLARDNYNGRRILFAAITDPARTEQLARAKVGDTVDIQLGMQEDELSTSVHITGKILQKGCVHNMHHETADLGPAITVSLADKPIDIIVSSRSITYCEEQQFEAAGLHITDYDVIAVKQGYLFPELKALASFYIMSLTPGATNQKTESVPYKRVMRPMYPLDLI